MAWKFAGAPQFSQRLKEWEQRTSHPQTQLFNNLHTVFGMLRGGGSKESLVSDDSFLTSHGEDIYSVGQNGTGHVSDQIPGMVYFYPDEMTKTIHVITIGDNQTQNEDLIYARSYVAAIVMESFASKGVAS